MRIHPSGQCDLDHRAYFLRGNAARSVIVAASEEGDVSVFNSEFMLLHRDRLATKLRAIEPHPTEDLLAWVDGESGLLIVQRLIGTRVAEVALPRLSQDAAKWTRQGFADCYFDETGQFLWAVGPVSDNEIELRLIDVSDWLTVQKTTIEDRFGSSSCSFHGTGASNLVAFWIAAGQDGQQIYWITRRGSRFSCELVEQLVNTTPPVFSPDRSAIVVLNQENSIRKYEFPSMKQIAALVESEDEDNPFAESMCYLDSRHVLASTGEGRTYLLDTEEMNLVEEVELAGHEPRPISEYYPSLTNESGLGTDITYFQRLGKAIVFVFRRERGTGLETWRDSLLWYLACHD